MSRTLLSCASARYFSAARTWRNHSRVVSAAKKNVITAARTVSRVPSLPSVTASPPIHLARPRHLRDPPEDRVQERGQQGIVEGGEGGGPEQEQEPAGELAQKERHEPVEQDPAQGGPRHQQNGQERAGGGDELPDRADRVPDQGQGQGGDPLGLVEQEVLGHPGREAT